MTVHLNGTPREVADDATVRELVGLLGMDRAARGVAVAVQARVVPRAEWETTRVTPGARVEVVTAMQGG
jgi:sulfur carrier protein